MDEDNDLIKTAEPIVLTELEKAHNALIDRCDTMSATIQALSIEKIKLQGAVEALTGTIFGLATGLNRKQ